MSLLAKMLPNFLNVAIFPQIVLKCTYTCFGLKNCNEVFIPPEDIELSLKIALLFSKAAAPKITQTTSSFHSLTCAALKGPQEINPMNPGGLFNQTTRTNIRCHFPRPSEHKRVKRHGWRKRMSTPEGRRVLMNRILKGRWVYSH